MRIALCAKGTFSLEIGSTKNRIELAESLKTLGWETVLIDKTMLGIPAAEKYQAENYSAALKTYLVNHAAEYDVVLHEYDTLPFDRHLFSNKTLFVARPALLSYHLQTIRFRLSLKARLLAWLKKILKARSGGLKGHAYYERIDYCLQQCDLIQVQNSKDRELLLNKGFPDAKIVVVPNGITSKRMAEFDAVQRQYHQPYVLACVGTFDFRKGALDLVSIFSGLKVRYPSLRLKLLGTRGMFSGEKEVLGFFPARLRSSVSVVPQFKATDLPGLLADCHLGIFPSYLESFGFGALEMMCAGLPVVAYDAPGPADFILRDLLIPTGDVTAMIHTIDSLLANLSLLKEKSGEAREVVAGQYCWDDIARMVDSAYKFHLGEIRNRNNYGK